MNTTQMLKTKKTSSGIHHQITSLYFFFLSLCNFCPIRTGARGEIFLPL